MTESSPRRWWQRRLTWILAVLLGLALAVYLAYAIWAVDYAESEMSRILGVNVKIGRATGLLTKDVKLSDVTLEYQDDIVGSIVIEKLEVELVRPALQGKLEARSITARGATFRVNVDALAALQERSTAENARAAERGELMPAPSVSIMGIPASIEIADSIVYLDFGKSGSETGHHSVPFTSISAQLRLLEPELARLDSISGRIHGGELSASAEIDPSRLTRFDLQLKLAGVSLLDAFSGTRFAGTTSGYLSAFIDIHGPGADQEIPLGSGWLDVRDARAWDLPLFSTSLDALGLEAEEEDMFSQARVMFRIDRGYYYFQEVQAVGSPVSIYGSGKMKLDGSELAVDLIPRVGPSIEGLPIAGEPTQLLLDVIKGAAVSIEVRGTIGAPEISTIPLPIITAPIRAFFDLVDG